MIALQIARWVLITVVIAILISQIAFPLIHGRRLFPILRRDDVTQQQIQAREELRELEERLDLAELNQQVHAKAAEVAQANARAAETPDSNHQPKGN